MKEFYDLEHARMRLTHCAVQLDDNFVYIEEVDSGPAPKHFRIVYKNIDDERKNNYVGFIPMQTIKTDRLRLGFVNDTERGTVYFASRLPMRAWKEGLSAGNIHVHSILDQPPIRMNNDQFLKSQMTGRSLKGEYPSFREAEAALETSSSCAFSRQFAITDAGDIIFRTMGVVGIKNEEIILKKDYQFLKELLDQEIENVR